MEKIAKRYLLAECCALASVGLSGLYDPSFLFYGACFVGLGSAFCGIIVSLVWYMINVESNQKVLLPITAFLGNVLALCAMGIFIYMVAAGGINFTM